MRFEPVTSEGAEIHPSEIPKRRNMSNPVKDRLSCVNCTATAANNSKEAGRFKRRHPSRCIEHQTKHTEKAMFQQQLAEGVRSVEE